MVAAGVSVRRESLYHQQHLSSKNNKRIKEVLDKARQNTQWSLDNIMKFLDFHKERVRHKELADGSLKKYYRADKLFCERNR